MKAIGVHIIVEKVAEKSKAGAFELSSKMKEGNRHRKGKVLSVGNEVPVIKEGDIVYYDNVSAINMFTDDGTRTMIEYRHVIAVE